MAGKIVELAVLMCIGLVLAALGWDIRDRERLWLVILLVVVGLAIAAVAGISLALTLGTYPGFL